MEFLETIVVIELVAIVAIGIWAPYCCLRLTLRVNYLEKKLKEIYTFFESMDYIVKCVDAKCPDTGDQDPTWPPDEIPKWP